VRTRAYTSIDSELACVCTLHILGGFATSQMDGLVHALAGDCSDENSRRAIRTSERKVASFHDPWKPSSDTGNRGSRHGSPSMSQWTPCILKYIPTNTKRLDGRARTGTTQLALAQIRRDCSAELPVFVPLICFADYRRPYN